MQLKTLIAAVVLGVAFAAGIYLALPQRDASTPAIDGLLWPDPPVLREIALSRAPGGPITDDRLRGKWTLVFFGFTHCPDVCPTTMETLKQVYTRSRSNPALSGKLQVLFVSVDPERDTAESLRAYTDYFSPEFIAATGSDDELKALARQLGVLYMKVDVPGQTSYSMDHSASILLIDPHLRFVGIFSQPHSVTDLIERMAQIVTFIEGTP